MAKPTAPDQLTACAVFHSEVAPVDGKLPGRVQLMPMGTHGTRNGIPPRIVLADRAHAEAVVAASDQYRGPNRMVVDYDHQTVRAPAVAGQAPAAGWISRLFVEDDGIWGEVEWTGAASAELADRRYRYISPYFAHRPDGRVTLIINAGLTNTPNLDLAAVASAMPPEADKGKPMDLKAIASALGLGEDADEAAVLAAIAALNASKTVLAATASALGAKAGDDLVAMASAAAKAGKPDPARFVPVEAVAELRSEMSALQARIDVADEEKKAGLIADAKAKGKLPPSLEAHARTLDMTALASFLAALPETGLGKSTLPGGSPANDGGALSDEEKAVASAFGMSEEEFIKARKEAE